MEGFEEDSLAASSMTGSFWPRSLPLLATPTPHVRVVLYPEHSRPSSRHCEQYGRRRSHRAPRLEHVKQSSGAPLTTVLLRRFRIGAFGSVLRDLLLAGSRAGSRTGRVGFSDIMSEYRGRHLAGVPWGRFQGGLRWPQGTKGSTSADEDPAVRTRGTG